MHGTSHMPMRSATIRIPEGCIRRERPGRGNERRRAIAESAGGLR